MKEGADSRTYYLATLRDVEIAADFLTDLGTIKPEPTEAEAYRERQR